MKDDELVRMSYEALARDRQRPVEERFKRLVDRGVIDEKGRVPVWDAFLAVIAVKRNSGSKRIEYFRCLQPNYGMPGLAELDVSRESLVDYVGREKKRVITARLNEQQRRWKEGAEIHLNPHGYLRVDDTDIEEDHLGELEEFHAVRNGA